MGGGGGGGGKNPKKIHARENAKKKNSCKGEGKEKKIHAEGRSSCDFFRKPEFLSESLSFRNQQYSQAQYMYE